MTDQPTPELVDLIDAYVAARQRREQSDTQTKRLRTIEAQAEAALFAEIERQNLRSTRHKTWGLFYLNDAVSPSVTDEKALRDWALEAMPELLLANRSRLASVVRNAIKEGDDLPPGVDFSTYRKIGWRDRPNGGGDE